MDLVLLSRIIHIIARRKVFVVHMRPPPESGGYDLSTYPQALVLLCFNEAAARKRRILQVFPSGVLAVEPASMRPPPESGGYEGYIDDRSINDVASMRPPPESGGYTCISRSTTTAMPGFNEAAARKRRILQALDGLRAFPGCFNEAAARKRRIRQADCLGS